MIHFLCPKGQDYTIKGFLEQRAGPLAERFKFLYYEDLLDLRELPAGSYIFAALDQLQPRGVDLVTEVYEQLRNAGPSVRVFNHPRGALRRLELLNSLHRAGLNQHDAVPATGDLSRLRFPVFLREENGHNGSLSDILHNRRELDQALAVTVARGHHLKDLLAVEFFETRKPNGHYYKYAAMVVGDRILPRGIASGKAWMLKAEDTEFTEELIAEELEYARTFPHEDQLRTIRDIARVEYGRIDYGVKDDRVETWEVNLNPTVGPRSGNQSRLKLTPELRALREPVRKIWVDGLISAFQALDVGGEGSPPVPVRLTSRPSASDLVVVHDAETRHSRLRSFFRPLKPLLMKTVRALSPLLLRLTRRRK
jgi:hypothetical protein